MENCEYMQDEGETVDLVVWEEYVICEEQIKENDWEDWVNSRGWSD